MRRVNMGMAMSNGSMRVRMRMHYLFLGLAFLRHAGTVESSKRNGFPESSYIHYSKNDQHDRDGKFHAESNSNWNYQVEENDRGADHEDRQGVANAPKGSNQRGTSLVLLITHDSSDGDHVIGIRGVTHPEKKSYGEDGE